MKSISLLLCSFLVTFPNGSSGRFFNIIEEEMVRRKTTFAPEVYDRTCLLKPEKGPCRGKIDTYFFNPATQNCEIFKWGGCQGNGNRFDTEEICKSSCLTTSRLKSVASCAADVIPISSHCPDVSGTQRFCKLTFDYGWCFGAEERWYFDSKWKVCKKIIYSGCGGNKNNFYNKEQCDQVCRFGNPPLTREKERGIKDGVKKILVMNPENKLLPPHPSTDAPNGNEIGTKKILMS